VVLSPASSWPYNLSFPDGGSFTQQMTVTAAAVSQPTTVTIFACEEDADISNPSNWRVTSTVTVMPPSAVYAAPNLAASSILAAPASAIARIPVTDRQTVGNPPWRTVVLNPRQRRSAFELAQRRERSRRRAAAV
jgi:hypothetical protein